MFWSWTTNIIHPRRYLSHSRAIHEVQKWEIMHCMDRIAELSNTIGDLIPAYQRLLGEIESCQNSVENLCLSPAYPSGSLRYDSPQNEYEWDLHPQQLYYKLVQVRLVMTQPELDQDYYEVKRLYKERKYRDSFFKTPKLSDEKVNSAVQVVKDWIKGGQGGKYGVVRDFVNDAMEYTVDGERKRVLEDFGGIPQVLGVNGVSSLDVR